jgi:hypothetical protein
MGGVGYTTWGVQVRGSTFAHEKRFNVGYTTCPSVMWRRAAGAVSTYDSPHVTATRGMETQLHRGEQQGSRPKAEVPANACLLDAKGRGGVSRDCRSALHLSFHEPPPTPIESVSPPLTYSVRVRAMQGGGGNLIGLVVELRYVGVAQRLRTRAMQGGGRKQASQMPSTTTH